MEYYIKRLKDVFINIISVLGWFVASMYLVHIEMPGALLISFIGMLGISISLICKD
tara:strand:- start:2946 stop:3113 length:168 start_codon:yes stop_codon:yes gene_type:complete